MKINQFPGYYTLKEKVFSFKAFNPNKNILIFADPRGGSTWLTEIIKEITRLPLMWEPLHVRKMPSLQSLNFNYRQYINENNTDFQIKIFFDNLFKGKLKDSWLYSQERNWLKICSNDAAVIKFCRGNLLLPYIVQNFEFNKKPIHLIRHPFAVVASQMKQGGWDKIKSKLDVSQLHEYPYNINDIDFLKNLTTKEEVLTVQWCLHNKHIIEHSKNNKSWITVTYEEMVMESEKTLNRILQIWQINEDIKRVDFQKKSFTSLSHHDYKREERLTKWKNEFEINQIHRMQEVLNFFEIDLYDSSIMPLMLYNNG